MTKEDHLEHLTQLEEMYHPDKDTFGFALWKREGAFYFGEGVSGVRYVELYREACVSEGWL